MAGHHDATELPSELAKHIVTWLSTKTQDVGTQRKDLDKVMNNVEDLVGLRGNLN